MANLQIEGVSKHFGRTQALNTVNLQVNDGEFMVLLGPTGAGKTTSLRCVAGLEKPDAGSIYLDNKVVNNLTPAERDVAFVFQSYALYPRKTVFENMAFPLEARQFSKSEIDQRVRSIAKLLAIDGLLDRRPAELSGGQQQRVALGRAMVRQPRLFLMDEPLTNLDFMLRVEMRAELKRLQNELHATFFYVTNDQIEAMSMADRVAILHEGVLQQVDAPEVVYDRPANLFVAGFVGNPRMNFLDCTLDKAQRLLKGQAWYTALSAFQIQRLETYPQGASLIFGIRPEDIQLKAAETLNTFPAEVYVVEPLGDRTIVDLRLGSEMLKVKVPPDFMAESGDVLGVEFDTARLHIFDKQSGLTVL